MICLDTNYLIRGVIADSEESRELSDWAARDEHMVTSSVAWYEFLCGPIREVQVSVMRQIVMEVLPFNESHALLAADLFNVCGRKRALRVDVMIAATAIAAGARLATRNRADFSQFATTGLTFV
jgi:predicted nucleic acid-binding protein